MDGVTASAAVETVLAEAPQHTAQTPRRIPTRGPENPVHKSIYDAGLVAAIEEASAQPLPEARPQQLYRGRRTWSSSWRVCRTLEAHQFYIQSADLLAAAREPPTLEQAL